MAPRGLAALALALLLPRLRSSPAPRAVLLTRVATLPTRGGAGFKHVTLGGRELLASAHFWDGVSADMEAHSPVFELVAQGDGLEVSLFQEGPLTRGAHGFDHVRTPGGWELLTVPSYYGCGSDRGSAAPACDSTLILEWSAARGQFVELQRLATAGPAQTGHIITRDSTVFLLVGENFNNQVCAYRLDNGPPSPFSKHACVVVPGAGAMAAAEIGDAIFLVAASYHDRGWDTETRVFRADATAPGAALAFVEHQRLPTRGCHDAAYGVVGGRHILFLAEDRGGDGPRIDSGVWEWERAASRFVLVQRLPTDGAHGGVVFEGPGRRAFIAVANFGDRLGGRYEASSALWAREPGGAGAFELVAQVDTHGATDVEHVLLGGRHFIAIAEEGDVGRGLWQASGVWEVAEEGGGREL